MILTVLIVAVAFTAEPEFKVVSVLLGPSAYGTFMLGNARTCPYFLLKSLPPVYLGRGNMLVVSCTEKEDGEIQEGCYYNNLNLPGSRKEFDRKKDNIQNGKPLYLDGNKKIKH